MRSARLIITLLLCQWLLACGVKSSPQPPLGGAPPQVGRVDARPRENAIVLSWTLTQPKPESKMTKPAKFEAQRRSKPHSGNVWNSFYKIADVPLPAEGNQVDWNDASVEENVDYQYRVAAIDSNGRRGPFSKPVLVAWGASPGAPTDLVAEPGDHFMALKWNAPIDGPKPEGYYIYRAEGYNKFTLLTKLAIPALDYLDTDLKNGATYRYVVRAMRAVGTYSVEGAASNETAATPIDLIAPEVPLGVGAFQAPAGGVQVVWWPNNEDDLAGYNVYRSAGKETIKLNDTPIKENQYIDATAQPRISYTYTVTAVDNAGNESPRSEPANVYIK